jgi:hypothetical protein
MKLIKEYSVRLAKDIDIFSPDLTQNSHPQPRSRERMPMDNRLRQSQCYAHRAHLVFKQFAQRFQQFKL